MQRRRRRVSRVRTMAMTRSMRIIGGVMAWGLSSWWGWISVARRWMRMVLRMGRWLPMALPEPWILIGSFPMSMFSNGSRSRSSARARCRSRCRIPMIVIATTGGTTFRTRCGRSAGRQVEAMISIQWIHLSRACIT